MPQKESGVIWHSQGSGKSLTMVALASYIQKNFSNPRVIVITDRKELDLQLAGTFVKGGNKVHHAESCSDLLDTLNKGEEWLICSLIHKFGTHNHKDEADKDESGTKVSLDEYLNELQAIIAKNMAINSVSKVTTSSYLLMNVIEPRVVVSMKQCVLSWEKKSCSLVLLAHLY